MNRLVLLLLIAGAARSPGTAADHKLKPQLDVIEMSAKRQQGLILIDARLRNSGERPLAGLVVIFCFQADAQSIVTTQRAKIDEATLPPGEETEISAQLKDAPRAVEVQILASDAAEREIPVMHGGPAPID